MADIVVTGGGVCGLNAGLLLAKDGHNVTLLERDPAPPPPTSEEAWDSWDRRGVNQARLPHLFLARFRILIEQELPEVAAALVAAGALQFNPIADVPAALTGGPRDGDDEFRVITGRRAAIEAAIARVADATSGLSIRRGVGVAGLVANADGRSGVPHVVGVATDNGEELRADLVVDATGRRSPLPRWLAAIGARPPEEEADDSGFVYYGRTYRSGDGAVPPLIGPPLQHHGSLSTLTAPADNGAWSLALVARADDAKLRALKDAETWATVFRAYPLQAHWLDGTPFEPEIKVMAKIEDRWRRFVIDGTPVATGIAPIADSWACTNPSFGRGASIGLLHAVALRDLLRSGPLDDPLAFATEWDAVTAATVEPWYRETLWNDHHLLGEMEASISRTKYESEDPKYELSRSMNFGAGSDPDVLRGMVRNRMLLAPLDDLFADLGESKVLAAGAGWRDAPPVGPTRDELEKLVGG